jgi:hypothetical protein
MKSTGDSIGEAFNRGAKILIIRRLHRIRRFFKERIKSIKGRASRRLAVLDDRFDPPLTVICGSF